MAVTVTTSPALSSVPLAPEALMTTLLTVGAVVSAVKLPVAAGVLPVTALPARSLTPATKLPTTAMLPVSVGTVLLMV